MSVKRWCPMPGRLPSASCDEVDNAALPGWYQNFKSVTIRTSFIPLPRAFVNYLLEDGIVLPSTVWPSSMGPRHAQDGKREGDDEEGGWTTDGGVEAPSFPDVEDAVATALEELGRAVCPKLNWTAPQDAAWVNGGSLKCTTVGDVFLLLKASTFLHHDIEHAYDGCRDKPHVTVEDESSGSASSLRASDPTHTQSLSTSSPVGERGDIGGWLLDGGGGSVDADRPPDAYISASGRDKTQVEGDNGGDSGSRGGSVGGSGSGGGGGGCGNSSSSHSCSASLAVGGAAVGDRGPRGGVVLGLRKWCNFYDASHFRVFVRRRRIVGICQRDTSRHFDFLEEEAPSISQKVGRFFVEHVRDVYPDPNVVMDVYVSKSGRVWLVDFNPYGAVTDGLLYSWTEDDVLHVCEGNEDEVPVDPPLESTHTACVPDVARDGAADNISTTNTTSASEGPNPLHDHHSDTSFSSSSLPTARGEEGKGHADSNCSTESSSATTTCSHDAHTHPTHGESYMEIPVVAVPGEGPVGFRVVCGSRGGGMSVDPMAQYRVPLDMLALDLRGIVDACQQAQRATDSSSEGDDDREEAPDVQ